MADVYLNYKDFLVNGNIPGTRESEIINYTFSGTTGDEIKDEGLYYDQKTGRWYKDFLFSSNDAGTTFYMPVLMDAEQIGDTYNFKSSAFVRQRSSDEYYSKVGKACGLEFWERGYQVLKNRVTDEITHYTSDVPGEIHAIYDGNGNVIDFVVDEFVNMNSGLIDPEPDLIDYIYDMFNEEFGDVSRRYEIVENDFSKDGSYIVEQNPDISSTIAYMHQEGEIFGEYSADQIKALVDEIKATDTQAVKNVFNHNFVRVMIRQAGLGDNSYYMHFVGYDVQNGTMQFTNNQGTVTVTASDYIEVFFKLGEDPRVERTGYVGNSYIIPVYTEPTASAFNLWGIPQGGGSTVQATAYDMVSATGTEKPYNLIPGYVYPTPETLPDRISDDPDDPDEPTPPQNYWPIGTPSPAPIKIKPPIGSVPPIPHDMPSEDTIPDVSGSQPNKGLTRVYNPTDAELNSLSAYLWDSSILTHLSQIWKNNPLDGIIGCHELYFTPQTAQNKEYIVLGDLTTTVESKYCVDRYQQLNCGYKEIRRFWNDVRDYQTKVSVYLPFIGFKELDVSDVMDTNLFIDYQIDILTGDCTATLSVQRKNASGNYITGTGGKADKKVLYVFDGNCSVPIMLTGADRNALYGGVVSGGLGIVSGIASAVSGNIMGGVSGVASGVASVTQAKPSIEKSGNIGGNRGAMAFKKPYLIITRPIPNEPNKRLELIGKPSNRSVRVNEVRGYAKFKTVHIDTIGNATDREKQLITNLLTSGVIL